MTVSKQSLPRLATNVIYLETLGFKRIQANLAYMDGWDDDDLALWNDELEKLADYYVSSGQECHCSLLDIKPDCIFVEQAKHKRCGCGHFIVCVDTAPEGLYAGSPHTYRGNPQDRVLPRVQ